MARFRSSPNAFRVIPFVGFLAAGGGSSGVWGFMPPPYHDPNSQNSRGKMSPVFRKLLVIAGSRLLAAGPGLAWNRAGHMVMGAIAYDELQRTSPATVARVVAILRQHPQYESRWKPQLTGMSEQDQERLLFMLAARWPDDIRGDSAFDHPMWHYIDYPYKPPGQPPSVPAPPPDKENMVAAFQRNVAVVQSAAPDAEKAVALCWIFHLLGDSHQPLHAVSLFTTQFPDGDRGGNLFFIRPDPSSSATQNLHAYWDNILLTDDTYDPARARAVALENAHPARNRSMSSPDREISRRGRHRKVSIWRFRPCIAKETSRAAATRIGESRCLPIIRPPRNKLRSAVVALSAYRLADFLRTEFSVTSRVILSYGNRAFGLRVGLPGLLLHAGAGGKRPGHQAARRPQPSRHAWVSVRQSRAISGARILARPSALSAKARRRQRRRPIRAHFLGRSSRHDRSAVNKRVAVEYGPEAILPYSYGGTMGMLNGAGMDRRFFHRLGASRLDRTICSTAGGAGLTAINGNRYATEPEQFRLSKLIIAWGANIHGANIHLWPFIVEARRNGAKFVVIDPIRTRTAALADQHLTINPGSDLALALGLMHVIIGEKLYDADYVDRYTNGFDALRERVSRVIRPSVWRRSRASRLRTSFNWLAIMRLRVRRRSG